jgi:hypothetical protein
MKELSVPVYCTGLENKIETIMKRVFFLLVLLLSILVAESQPAVNLVMNANPPSTLSQWNDRRETLTYIVTYRQGSVRQAKIRAEFKLTDGTVVGSTDLARARTITLADGNNLYYAADVLPLDMMIFTGRYKNSLEKTGKLPADNYQLCVQLVNPVDYAPVSEQRCRIFNLAALQLSIPVMPANEVVLDASVAQTAITFRWTPVSPRPVFPVTYRIMVFEVLDKQQPVQAMRSNQPLLVKDVVGTTQYIWQPQLGMIDCCPVNGEETDSLSQKAGVSTSRSNVRTKKFVWTLQCLDNTGQPLGDGNINGDGISEPAVFSIGKKSAN